MSPNRVSAALALQFLLILALLGCGDATGADDGSLFTEPCIPLDGSEIDPCARDTQWDVETGIHGSYSEAAFPKLPYNILDRIRWLSSRAPHGLYTPQFFVRGTFVPDSTRCTVPRASVGLKDDGQLVSYHYETGSFDYVTYHCYTDLMVHEYLNGTGPSRLPIALWTHAVYQQHATADYVAAFANRDPMRSLEGREMVFSLVRPSNLAIGAWDYSGFVEFWDVQRRDDGEVVVVGGWAHVDSRFNYEFTLDDFRADVKSAMAAFRRESGGRVGADTNDRKLAGDANLGTLLENLRDYGAYSVVDITPAPAPTVPGENDPDPYGLFISDAAETAVPEVPGGLEGTATPVSALGDEPTATATVEPAVTPEPTPTLGGTPMPETSAKETSGTATSPASAYDSRHTMRIDFATRGKRAA